MALSIRNAGAWDSTVTPYGKSAGVWSKARPLWVKSGGVWVPVTNPPLKSVLSQLGLLSTAHVVLDAGDTNSFSVSSAQSWNDLSGLGNHFFLGTTSASESSDPTWNGTADGLSSAEYFSLDGADLFKYSLALPAWVNTLHKAGATFSWAGWFNTTLISGNIQAVWGTTTATGPAGIQVQINQSGLLGFVSAKATGSGAIIVDSTLTVAVNTWAFIAGSINEAGGAGASYLQLNGSTYAFNSAYSSPATTSTTALSIGATGGGVASGNYPMKAGGKVGMLAIWGGSTMSTANMLSVFNNTRDRYGI